MIYVTFTNIGNNYQFVVRSFHTKDEAEEFKNDLIRYNRRNRNIYTNIKIDERFDK